MALSPDGKTLYVVQRKLNQIAKVDTASLNIVKTARLGKRPDMLAISPDGERAPGVQCFRGRPA